MTWFPIGPNAVFGPRDPSFTRLSRRNEFGKHGQVQSIAFDPTDTTGATIYVTCMPHSGGASVFATSDNGGPGLRELFPSRSTRSRLRQPDGWRRAQHVCGFRWRPGDEQYPLRSRDLHSDRFRILAPDRRLQNIRRMLAGIKEIACRAGVHTKLPRLEKVVHEAIPGTRVVVEEIVIPPMGSVTAAILLCNGGNLPPGSRYRFQAQQVVAGRVVGGSVFVVQVARSGGPGSSMMSGF